jgi:hypothetical protein
MPNDGPVRGVVLADQARSLSWEKRYVQRIDQAPATLVADVRVVFEACHVQAAQLIFGCGRRRGRRAAIMLPIQ